MEPRLVDTARLRENVTSMAEGLERSPSAGVATIRVRTELVGQVTARAMWSQYGRDFELVCDEAPGRGGSGHAPSPLRYFLAGLAFCLDLWYAKGAALTGCELESLEVDVEASLDFRPEFRLARVAGRSDSILVDVRVQSPLSSTDVLRAVDEGNVRCPLRGVVGATMVLRDRVTHNGHVIRETVAEPTTR
jgi:uncharacterized OsmC-like protein